MSSFDASPEHAPMSGLDEFLIHNSPEPVRVMYTSDPRAYERHWFTCQDKVGDLIMVMGIGFYPNLDTADAYALVNYKGQHTHVRYHRRLGLNRMDMRMGPLNFEVVEPFKTWKLTLDENPYGIRYEIYWHYTKRPIFHELGIGGGARGGIRATDSVGYEGFGVQEGWIEVDGQRFTLDTDKYLGSRDHHWGARGGVGGPIGAPPPGGGGGGIGGTHVGQWVEFSDWSIWLNSNLYPLGDERAGAGAYTTTDRHLKFEPETGLFVEGTITNVTESGETKELHYRRLGNQTAFLGCGGYLRTPDGGPTHGIYPGEDKLFGGTYDVNTIAGRKQLTALNDHHCEVTCDGETTYGILETVDPSAYETFKRGVPGYRLLE